MSRTVSPRGEKTIWAQKSLRNRGNTTRAASIEGENHPLKNGDQNQRLQKMIFWKKSEKISNQAHSKEKVIEKYMPVLNVRESKLEETESFL